MNFANSLLKDIKGNSSINQFGSKIKNMSQSFVPENAKDMLASATNSISTAANSNLNLSNITGSSQTNLQRGQSSQKISTDSGVYSSKSPSNSSMSLHQQQQQQQQYQQQQQAYRSARTESATDQQMRSHLATVNEPNKRSTSQPMNKPRQQPVSPEYESQLQPQQPQQQQSSLNQVDQLEMNALKDTNEALKSEVQRLSLFELKSKSLEKEARVAKELRETNEKLESEVKELNKYRAQCQKLETEIKQLKQEKQADEERFKSFEKQSYLNKEKLELENQNLKNKIRDLDKMIDEYEKNFAQFKEKEQSLERRVEYLESELDRLTNGESNSARALSEFSGADLHGQKIDALEQANRILEQELESLKHQQKVERDKVKEKMDLLHAKQNEKLKKLEDSNEYYRDQLEKTKKNESETVEYLRKQCDDLRQRVNELELSEHDGDYIEKSFNELKEEMKSQTALLSEERRKLEIERKNFNELNADYFKLNETIQAENLKHAQEIQNYEERLSNLQAVLDRKEAEINELRNSKDSEISDYLAKLASLNEENLNLVNQLKNINKNANVKEEELNKQRKNLNELVSEYDSLRTQLKTYSHLETDIVEMSVKNGKANERITELEGKIAEWERKYNKELEEFNNFSQLQQQQIKQMKQQLTAEQLKHENLNADFSLLKLETSKLESLKAKCDHLEAELREAKSNKLNRLSEYEMTASKFNETNEKYETEIKMLNSQISSLRNDMKIKEQECKQLEKTIDTERAKTLALVKQLEELNTANTQLTMQNAEYKRRLVSLDLLTDECNQLRKNLTLMTIESESRKAEISTLNSQISILENTVKTLRETSEKHSKLELNYDTTSYELKKKQEDFKRLQQLHETVKKEQLETIELLEEKLRDVEKKTELQSLKHEEIMLELESIRAKRERLVPFCPKCSTQQVALYQPMQPPPQSQQQQQQQQQQPTQQPTANTQSNPPQFNIPPNLPAQPLLSISIPQQQISPSNISPANMSPYQAIQAQAHLSHFQVITLPGKQSVTVECQTSPTNEKYDVKKSFDYYQPPTQPQPAVSQQPVKKVEKSNASSQTVEPVKRVECKEVNTDPIDFSFMNKKQPPQPPAPPKPVTRNQSVNVNFYEKSLEEKGVQSNLENVKEKYYLYACKYSYDPFKNSPNDNPEAELPLLTGDYVYILNEEDEYGFYNGELLNGRRGLVPSNFVERVSIDTTNITKSLQNIPKHVLSHPKFKECCNVSDLGQVIMATQQLVQKLTVTPVPKLDEQTQTASLPTASVATSTLAISTSTVSTMTIAQPTQPSTASAQLPLAKQTSSAKTEKLNILPTSLEEASDTSIKIGLPYPNNLKVEKFSEKSVIVTWDPPSAPISLSQSIDGENLTGTFDMNEMNIIQSYNVYLNHDLYVVVNISEDRVVIIDDVDLSLPNRVSVQAVVNKEISSKPQECTLLFGSNRSFAPSNLSAFSITQTSAIVSWWPSSSLFSHIISIDSIEHRTLKPGVYRFKLSGLLPDTSHLVIVTAQIPNHTNESSSNYAASVEFRTLPSKVLGIPQNLSITKDPNEVDSYNLSWEPPVSMNNPVSNGVPVGGYSIYLDGIRVHQILNPIASTVSLSSKLLFNGAKLLTVRTLSLDGNSESKDSQPIKLSKSLMGLNQQQTTQIQSKMNEPSVVESPKKKPETHQSTGLFSAGNLIQNFSNELNSLKSNTKNVLNEINKPQTGPIQAQQQPLSQQQQQQQQHQSEMDKRHPQVVPANPIVAPVPKKPANPIMKNMPLVSDISKKKQQQQQPASKSNIDTDADLYENFRNEPAKQPAKQPQKANVQNQMFNTPNIISTPQKKTQANEKDINRNIPAQQQQHQPQQQMQSNQMLTSTNKSNGVNKQNYRLFIALFDYDPYQMSPNQDSCSEELPFKEGQLIKIFGEQDDDGFFYGESNGRTGYIPCNMVQEVQDPNLVSQLLNETQPNTSHETDLRNKQTNLKDSSSKSKTTKQTQQLQQPPQQQQQQQQLQPKMQQQQQQQQPQMKDQAFQPVGNQQYSTSKPQAKNVCTMIALYDYDPQSLSPNVDVDIELPFKTGDIITVIGEMDEDGFFMAELRGKRGLVPSNFLQPIQPQDQQYYNNLQQQQSRK